MFVRAPPFSLAAVHQPASGIVQRNRNSRRMSSMVFTGTIEGQAPSLATAGTTSPGIGPSLLKEVDPRTAASGPEAHAV